MISCKTITANLLTIVCLLVAPRIFISKPKGSPEAYIPIRQPSWTVTYKYPVIYSSLSSFFYFGSMLRSNSRSHQIIEYWWSTVEIYVRNSAGHCESWNGPGKWSAWQVETVSCSSTSSRGGMLFSRIPVSVGNNCWSNQEQFIPRIIGRQ